MEDNSIKKEILRLLSIFNLRITHKTTYDYLVVQINEFTKSKLKQNFINGILNSSYTEASKVKSLLLIEKSRAQLHQDLIALLQSDFKTQGYFVEFGATDGITLSNTYLLEKEFGWHGILAEPGRCWTESLQSNRNAAISLNCVWSSTGAELEFVETQVRELSTVASFTSSDAHAQSRQGGQKYKVISISLVDLLVQHNAPKFIDYLSIDTEGSEFEILEKFDFSSFVFGLISCEHNFTQNRVNLYNLLSSNGYVRILEGISQFDDFYVHQSLLKS
jgi:FkbM family methyltransferase